MLDLNKEREAFEASEYVKTIIHKFEWSEEFKNYQIKDCVINGNIFDLLEAKNDEQLLNGAWFGWQEKAKAQVLPTWISVDDEWPPTDIMVLICWADAPDVTPEQDYMTIDEDLNSVWANYHNDAPSHWMHFHSVPNVSGAANE
ncbi:DUF551 domain-containing protein [Acinetobacter baumannii]